MMCPTVPYFNLDWIVEPGGLLDLLERWCKLVFGQMDDPADLQWCAQLFPTSIWNGLLNQVRFRICFKYGASCFFGQMDDPVDLQ